MEFCNYCGGKFKIEFITTNPGTKKIIFDGYRDSSEEYMALVNKIKSEGIKGVQIRGHPETSHFYLCQVISHEDWIKRYRAFVSHKELNDENKKKFREKIQKYFLRRFVCVKCRFSTDDKYWGNKESLRATRWKPLGS
ncbi:hypothetical protein LCGC14_1798870 [marine sediment metagenome]|uniref:Uncharacterized protein n=1 Tax=marine sediment metagenome TaxID=412755 RepID=A0A0F9J4Z6_9ZZZZ